MKKQRIVKTICSKCKETIDISHQGNMMYDLGNSEGKSSAIKEVLDRVLQLLAFDWRNQNLILLRDELKTTLQEKK